ncbi:glycosyltransferase family 2 protein [Rheinheimera sediminis]|uniref:glycosyltransferase family 2 protein n=1 Tax=Rheinheimera sp. YQF-1 TaxID=2499626 RepID=UPI000FD85235|nr:glycosyltransferase family 2 protein [Rheinheimera sp. YQF-1]RVT46916.1 glycosyltransferase family 2 protein [Rheinheimera sp. YQF-1]
MTPLVSILIPVYNRENIITETLESALAQTHDNIEVIVVDNASTDDTWRVIKEFAEKDSRVLAFRNEVNLGPVRNWLLCVERARGEIGKILWSDDLIAKDFLERTLPLLRSDVGFVYTGVKIFTDDKPDCGTTHYQMQDTGIYDSVDYINKILSDLDAPFSPGCAIFRMNDIRKNLWLDIPNKIKSDFSMHAIGNDLMLFLLTASNYKFFGHVTEPLAFFRAHGGSISTSSTNGKLLLHYALAKAHFVENFLPAEKNNLAARIQVMLWKYKDSTVYNMHSVSDFFSTNVSVSKRKIFMRILKKILRLPKNYFNKFFN